MCSSDLRALLLAAVLLVLPAEGYHSDETLTLLAAKHSKHSKQQKQKKVLLSKPSVTAVKTSVAHKTERYAALGATLKYLTAEEGGPDGTAGTKERRKIGGGQGYGTVQNYPELWEEGMSIDGVWTAAVPAEGEQADWGADIRPLIKERSEAPDWGNWGNKNNKKKDAEKEKEKEKEEKDKLLPETKKHRAEIGRAHV